VPADRNCLRVDFRFLSDEFPEYVGGTVNDAFVAELDASNFTINPDASVNAPNNFAFDAGGNLVSVNTAAFSETEAAGTTYDGATPRLRASTPITPGLHAIYLSTFDQGDDILDSAAFVDALRLENVPADACQSGSSSDVTPPAAGVSGPAGGSTSDSTPVLSGPAGDAPGDSPTVVVNVYSGPTVSGSPIRSVSTARSGASWLAEISPALPPGTYTAQAEQFDGAGNLGRSAPITFTVTSAAGGGGGGGTGGGGGGGQQLPPPVAGQSFNVQPVSGVVTFRCGNGPERRLEEAEQLPVGCRIDARRGKVRITSAAGNGKTQSAVFHGGVFKVIQKAGRRPVTELRLVGKLENCPRGRRSSATASGPLGLAAAKRGRRLWGDGKGRFRTRGRRSAATVTGTKWLVEDRCDTSTFTKVTRGRVDVRDFARRRTIKLRAGQSYLARPPRRGRR
jgi:Bacterial Ig-like domain